MTTTVETNAVTGEVTIRVWTQEEIDARKARLMPSYWNALRAERNRLLELSDIHVLPDRWSSYDSATQQAWTVYRQALRDLPANTVDPTAPIWPVPPAS